MMRLVLLLVLLAALCGCGDVTVAISRDGNAVATSGQESEQPAARQSPGDDSLIALMAGFFVNTWGAVLFFLLLVWWLFPVNRDDGWR